MATQTLYLKEEMGRIPLSLQQQSLSHHLLQRLFPITDEKFVLRLFYTQIETSLLRIFLFKGWGAKRFAYNVLRYERIWSQYFPASDYPREEATTTKTDYLTLVLAA